MKRYAMISAVFLSLCVLHGCAGNQTPVANVASPAIKVEQTGSAILAAAQTANSQTNPITNKPVISTVQLDVVALACDKLGRIGTKIAQGLTDYNAAKAAGSNTAALALAIQGLVADATSALGSISNAIPNGTVAAIDQAVASALGLYAQIKAGVL